MYSQFNYSKLAGKMAVKQAAEHLMLSNGGTTTLEVKNLLRAQGYEAYQADVSIWMDRLCYELDWVYSCNGRFRSYRYRLETDFDALPQIPAFSMN